MKRILIAILALAAMITPAMAAPAYGYQSAQKAAKADQQYLQSLGYNKTLADYLADLYYQYLRSLGFK